MLEIDNTFWDRTNASVRLNMALDTVWKYAFTSLCYPQTRHDQDGYWRWRETIHEKLAAKHEAGR